MRLASWSLILCAALACSSPAGPAGGTGGSGESETGGAGGSTGGRPGTGGSATGGSPATPTGGVPGTGGAMVEADAGQAPEAGAPDAAADAGSAVPPGVHKVYLLVGDIHTTDQSRLQLIQILESMKESHGVQVVVMDSRMAKASTVSDASLIIAGPNNNYCSDNPDPSLKSLEIPIMVSRDCKTTMFGLGFMMNTQEYITNLPVKLEIVKSDHPLAAGLSGLVGVLETRCRLVRGRDLGPDAIKIAKSPADATPAFPDSYPIFAYEKGGMMVGGFRAPAKRMGFFWHRPSAVTPEGKKLFVAAIDWLLRP
jgi:hypothetical protein